MLVVGIETSCDECCVSIVEDGCRVLSHAMNEQTEVHRKYSGVVPELASRAHVEHILSCYRSAITQAGCSEGDIDGIAVTYCPGLSGSLAVGLAFAKGLAYSLDIPYVGVDHILAHLYAPRLEAKIDYPYLGLLASGGHTLIAKVDDFDRVTVLGATVDDACGEAFDKVARHLGLGYPGGARIDALARSGDGLAADFPLSQSIAGKYDFSYSGLKTAVIHQIDRFWDSCYPRNNENIAAAFQRAAIGMLVDRVVRASADFGLKRIAVGGGVASNSLLRQELAGLKQANVMFPSQLLCTDNAAMVAGVGFCYLRRGDRSDWGLDVVARMPRYRASPNRG